ncbi:hypothetical protein [Microbispora sp. H10949]|uniref:hypothetical protein n=1 Tax=Microbispora sp. H10949 TaxID=2729111 RepID=UPI00160071B3|nr:hypothetical protein [Microbispora sp. H10949]
MKVSSPIGELPFEPRSIRARDGGIRMEGVMGAWPAKVEIDADDIPGLLRLVLRPAVLGVLIRIAFAQARRALFRRR